ncbi:hypothetical protein Goklo_013679 [Gossypium klotzschianum]|uniref:Uncharacterized protein n=1 Tax=Gossypium klotzschianum TaxID=34286 RepID=A0A7J8U5F9_9ROSI|nr:hypothetical protein [Gossypium klotzschianum]
MVTRLSMTILTARVMVLNKRLNR